MSAIFSWAKVRLGIILDEITSFRESSMNYNELTEFSHGGDDHQLLYIVFHRNYPKINTFHDILQHENFPQTINKSTVKE